MAPVDVRSRARTIVDVTGPLARRQGLRLLTDFVMAPDVLQTDARKLDMILTCLLNNAIKFTKRGSITFSIVESDGAAQFVVSDSGVGISDADLERVGEPFWQARQDMVREAGGMGLGLAVARNYASLLGGTLSWSSVRGIGSVFTLELPR